MSRRLVTSRVSRSVSSSVVRNNIARSSSDRRNRGSARSEIDALIDASGVRRSCDTDPISAARSRSTSSSSWSRLLSSTSRARSAHSCWASARRASASRWARPSWATTTPTMQPTTA
jgi:hypothetical protein